MFRFKCTVTRTGKRPFTRLFKCNTDAEAKEQVRRFLPPHLCQQAWIVNREETRWRKSSDWCSVVLELIQ